MRVGRWIWSIERPKNATQLQARLTLAMSEASSVARAGGGIFSWSSNPFREELTGTMAADPFWPREDEPFTA